MGLSLITTERTRGMEDFEISIAVGKNRYEKQWENKTIKWSAMLAKLEKPYRTRETYAEFTKMSKTDQTNTKDVGGFVGGKLKDGRRTDGNVLSRSMLTLDADFAPIDLWDEIEMLYGNTVAIYSTHSHSASKPRYRLVLPLTREVTPDEYQAIARKVAEQIGIDYFDDTTYQASRLMYWPSCSSDGLYEYHYLDDMPVLDPDSILALYDDWTDMSFWPMSSRVNAIHKKSAAKQGDPLAKEGLIGAFCRTYSITDAIATFLAEVYVPSNKEDRYTYVGGSTSGGLVVYEDKFAYSNHATDPCSMRDCNAFDLVRIHKFGALDVDINPNTSINKYPSWLAMMDLIREDKNTRVTVIQEQWQDKNKTDEPMPVEDLEWELTLERHSKTSQILSTINNVVIILEHDKLLKDIFAYDLFGQRPVALRDLPWRRLSDTTPEIKDRDDASMRLYLEKNYGINGRGIIEDAIVHVTYGNTIHPIRDYINNCVWDGISRIDSLLIDYFGAEDSKYTRAVTRKTLCAAVARIFRPGVKFDTMLTLIGGQGMGKTSFFERLGRAWFSNSMPTFKGKEAMESLQGVWILEVGEMAAMKKAESEEVKNLLSKTRDNFRVAYGRRGEVFPRQCILVGTTNKKEIFRDTTGNRRFWPVDCKKNPHKKKKFFEEFNEQFVDQVWAEAKVLWDMGETLYLTEELEDEAFKVQEEHKEVDIRMEPIVKYLETLLPDGWEDMDLDDRREYLDTNYKGLVGVKQRDRVCVLEIVQECFNQNTNNMDNYKAKEYNDILHSLDGWEYKAGVRLYKPYKQGRGFMRKKR